MRGHLAELGIVVAKGPVHLREVVGLLESGGSELPDTVRKIARLYLDQIDVLGGRIEELAAGLRLASQEQVETRRLCTVPGVGPVTAGAIMSFAHDLRTFASGRNFAAWLGLAPRQRSTRGTTLHGGVSKTGQTDIRKLLIAGRDEPDPLDHPQGRHARQLARPRGRPQAEDGGRSCSGR